LRKWLKGPARSTAKGREAREPYSALAAGEAPPPSVPTDPAWKRAGTAAGREGEASSDGCTGPRAGPPMRGGGGGDRSTPTVCSVGDGDGCCGGGCCGCCGGGKCSCRGCGAAGAAGAAGAPIGDRSSGARGGSDRGTRCMRAGIVAAWRRCGASLPPWAAAAARLLGASL
jgi:hypothetical protein